LASAGGPEFLWWVEVGSFRQSFPEDFEPEEKIPLTVSKNT